MEFSFFKRGEITGHPYNDDDTRQDCSVPIDGLTMWTNHYCEAVLFHITTRQAADSILNTGPKPNVCRAGFGGEEMPAAFWTSTIPLVYPFEVWLPHLHGEPLVTIGVTVPVDIALERIRFHPPWPAVQMALQVADIATFSIVEDPMKFRSSEAIANIEQLRRDHELDSMDDFLSRVMERWRRGHESA